MAEKVELKNTRKAILRKMSVNEMAEASGIGASNLCYKLLGKVKLNISDVIKMASVLNMKPEELFKIVVSDIGHVSDVRKKATKHICSMNNCFEIKEAWKCCCYCEKVRECPIRCYNTPTRCGKYAEGD